MLIYLCVQAIFKVSSNDAFPTSQKKFLKQFRSFIQHIVKFFDTPSIEIQLYYEDYSRLQVITNQTEIEIQI